jgi:hypothetical protein
LRQRLLVADPRSQVVNGDEAGVVLGEHGRLVTIGLAWHHRRQVTPDDLRIRG